MDFNESCESYFGTKDLYEILHIPRNASQQEVRRAYHKLSLSVHPDRVEEGEKEIATEKFKVLGKVHSILSDVEKRSIYDETGSWEDNDEEKFEERDWMSYWRTYFKQVTLSDINKYEEAYKGSEQELEDIKDAYEKYEGDYDKMLQSIMFATLEDENRIRGRIQELIDKKEIPAYKIFTHEPQEKRDRRIRRMKKEAKEAEEAEKEHKNLQSALQKNISGRKGFLEELEKKYSQSGKTKKKSKDARPKK